MILLLRMMRKELAVKLDDVYHHYDEYSMKFSSVKAEIVRFDMNQVAKKYLDAYRGLLNKTDII